MRPGWAVGTDRWGTSGGYTEVMQSAEPASQGPANRESPEADRHAISSDPLDPAAVAASVSSDAKGALTTFIGLVRDHNAGQRVRWIDYEAHEPLARRVFARIGREARDRWPDADLAIHHRTGRVAIGEASVVIAAASAHRANAFAACRFAIERVKQIAPVWKHEFFVDGHAWVEGAIADPADDEARRVALERACA